jgi:hypothetical protein
MGIFEAGNKVAGAPERPSTESDIAQSLHASHPDLIEWSMLASPGRIP